MFCFRTSRFNLLRLFAVRLSAGAAASASIRLLSALRLVEQLRIRFRAHLANIPLQVVREGAPLTGPGFLTVRRGALLLVQFAVRGCRIVRIRLAARSATLFAIHLRIAGHASVRLVGVGRGFVRFGRPVARSTFAPAQTTGRLSGGRSVSRPAIFRVFGLVAVL